ncbi:hypothetical protein [Niastella sp. OAS944]|uniref:hypothetical protein n=1 Tax=Niastella sp. OAS944 TaxID=2664089 RepID=UPI0034829062|nr:hypothetical protein [Chitinophagaceae bacterium OAS944]
MAKSNNIVTHELSGTIDNLTFVNSKAYGPHVRRKRGTDKEAVLNETMKESSNKLIHVNQIASLIFKSISSEHKDGKLWRRLLSKLRLQLRDYNFNDVSCLFNLECHTTRTLEKMFLHLLDVKVHKIEKRQMHIHLNLPDTPLYDKKYLKEFQISMHILYPDFENSKLKKEVACSDVLQKGNCAKAFSFAVPVPAKATEYAIFMKVTECEDGEALNYPQSTGMRCVAVGVIERKQQAQSVRKAPVKKKRVVKKAPQPQRGSKLKK